MKVLAALAFFCLALTGAKAEDRYVPNSQGGWIVLFDAQCGTPSKGQLALTFVNAQQFLSGCWVLVGNEVAVTWSDGDLILYPLAPFMVIKPWMRPGTPQLKAAR